MSLRWTIQDLERLKKKGLLVPLIEANAQLNDVQRKLNAPKRKTDPEGLRHIKQTLQLLNIPFVTEFKFHATRKFRFDVAFPEHKLALEYEGLVSEKSRHTTITGYTRDCDKYNEAVLLGWKVFRFTAINYRNFYSFIQTFLNDGHNLEGSAK